VDYVESYIMLAEYFDFCIVTYFGCFPSGEIAKTWFIYKNPNYIPRLTKECISLCSSVNREI
jgi:hypothetical protein